jgi:iron(III) transport system substrate-binding protein
LLASGEIDVAPGSVSSNTVDTLRDEGAPLAWQPPVEPIVRQRQGVALVRDAPHPATALLFLDFEMGPGLDVLAADHRAPARVGYASTGGARSTLVDLQSLSAQQAELGRRVDRLAGLGKK